MNEFQLALNETCPFKDRLFGKLIPGAIGAVLMIFGHGIFGVLLIAWFGGSMLSDFLKANRFFITDITLRDKELTIIYRRYNTLHFISGDVGDYTFYINSTAVGLYLDVLYKGERIARQYKVLVWDQPKFEQMHAMWEEARR